MNILLENDKMCIQKQILKNSEKEENCGPPYRFRTFRNISIFFYFFFALACLDDTDPS